MQTPSDIFLTQCSAAAYDAIVHAFPDDSRLWPEGAPYRDLAAGVITAEQCAAVTGKSADVCREVAQWIAVLRLTARDTMPGVNRIAGTGQHSHEVPTARGVVVLMRDGASAGTSVWFDGAKYHFADHTIGHARVYSVPRCALVRGLDVHAIPAGLPYACDLESPDGLVLLGLDGNEPGLAATWGGDVLWDSDEVMP